MAQSRIKATEEIDAELVVSGPANRVRKQSAIMSVDYGIRQIKLRADEKDVWPHQVWTKRQSPEWKPRRASVSACQLHHHHQQQHTAKCADCNYQELTCDTTTLTDSTSIRELLSQRLHMQSCIRGRGRHLDSTQCLTATNSNNKTIKVSTNDDWPLQKQTSDDDDDQLDENYSYTQQQQNHDCSLPHEPFCNARSNQIDDDDDEEDENVREMRSELDRQDLTLCSNYRSPIETGLTADKQSNRSSFESNLDAKLARDFQQLTTCCSSGTTDKLEVEEKDEMSELTAKIDQNYEQTVVTSMREKLHLHEKQRKFLIFSMALKQHQISNNKHSMSNKRCYKCRSKSCTGFKSQQQQQQQQEANYKIRPTKQTIQQQHQFRYQQDKWLTEEIIRSSSPLESRSLSLVDNLLAFTTNSFREEDQSKRKSSAGSRSGEVARRSVDLKQSAILHNDCEYDENGLKSIEDRRLRIEGVNMISDNLDEKRPSSRASQKRHLSFCAGKFQESDDSNCADIYRALLESELNGDRESFANKRTATNKRPSQHRASFCNTTSHIQDSSESNICDLNLEALIVESWLDDHPSFVHDYFMRKASHQLIDDWLIANAKVSNTNLNSQSDLTVNLITSPTVHHQAHNIQNFASRTDSESPKISSAADSVSSSSIKSNKLLSERLGADTDMPVRKISATDFESRTGNAFLRSMVNTTPDGRPTFLSQVAALRDEDDSLSKLSREIKTEFETKAKELQISLSTETAHDKLVRGHNDDADDSSGDEMTRTDEVKLIFELVKNICNDLDIRTLLHKILKNIAVLINADKSSLFLVCGDARDPNRHLVSQLFNVDQDSEVCNNNSTSTSNEPNQCITIPWGTGLVGYVAESGESLNIANCYEDPRFTNTIDQRTGYVTRHMLCAPIYDKRNEIVGVAQVINKRDGKPFSKSDEIKFKRYLQFCGIGLRNAQSYEQCQLENRRNQVLLDLARMVFEEQSTIEQVVYRIMLHTQSLLECQRCQVLLIDDGSDDLDQLLQLPNTNSNNSNNNNSPYTFYQQPNHQHHQADNIDTKDETPLKPKWRPQCNTKGLSAGETSIHQETTSNREIVEVGSCEKPKRLLDGAARQTDAVLSGGEGVNNERIQVRSDNSLTEAKKTKNQQLTKLFSLVFDLECDGNDLVVHSNKEGDKQNSTTTTTTTGSGMIMKKNTNIGERQFPINIGITGYVARTGETLNIEDAHKNERFDPSVDEGSNFKHKSILCMPIRNGQRQIIGVSQLINKKNGRPFNKNDEDLFEAFAIFCGLGIHNTLMYEKVLKIMAKQRVTFDVLSYHATAPLEEAKKLNMEQIPSCFTLNLASLKFNDFSLDEQFMLKACLRFFLDLDLIRRFQIDQLVFCNWILSVQKNYRKVTYHPIVGGNGLKASPVRYHNWRHAFNVTQMMFAILIICQPLGELETLALLIACLCHDLDHRGTNNSFQIKSASPLADLYSTSTMEHHHFDQCVMILNSQGNQILANLSPDEYSRVIVLLEEAILATDLANYFKKRELFFQLVNSNQFDWQDNAEHRSLLRCMLMTACDVAAITKPWSVQKVVADLVMSEFYQQGDIEKHELNIEPIDLMNRDKMSKLPDMQIGFIDSICAPIYTAFARLFPRELGSLLEGCINNRTLWTDMAQKNELDAELHDSHLNNNSTSTMNSLPKKSSIGLQDPEIYRAQNQACQEEICSNHSFNSSCSLISDPIEASSNNTTSDQCGRPNKVDCQRKSV